jgi:hypothetical protein
MLSKKPVILFVIPGNIFLSILAPRGAAKFRIAGGFAIKFIQGLWGGVSVKRIFITDSHNRTNSADFMAQWRNVFFYVEISVSPVFHLLPKIFLLNPLLYP